MSDNIFDKQTGFYNKASATAELTKACRNERGVLLIIDLDNFKLVNDIYGLTKGDELIRLFADVIKNNTRNDDIIGRSGGDEFVVFCRNVTDEKTIAGICSRINEQIIQSARSILGEDMSIPLGVSIGGVFVPTDGTEFESLFDKADKALYFVKQNGKHSYSIYGGKTKISPVEARSSEEDIKHLSEMLEEHNTANCAFWLGQDAFSNVYRFMIRYIKSYRGAACKVLFTLKQLKEDIEPDSFTVMAQQFGEMLNRSLRKSDIMMQVNRNQFFLLLPEIDDEYIKTVTDRICEQWNGSGYASSAKVEFVYEFVVNDDVDENDRRA
ncbi:MAG: GGDEF domain-containing protein [Clostridiales bacterium]|nr:GGDEF domain-containing protein [Clostridiales bacterium]